MDKRRLASIAIGLALSLTLVGSAAADLGDDVREDIDIPMSAEFRDQIDISPDFGSDDSVSFVLDDNFDPNLRFPTIDFPRGRFCTSVFDCGPRSMIRP
jgi:hypothetical protein